MAEKFEIFTFKDGEFALDVRADKIGETVWLTQREIAELFNVSIDDIALHTKNIYLDNELSKKATSEESSVV